MATEREKKAFRDSLAAGVDKYVKQQGRNTFELNCRADAACEGYVRIPGPDACEFCVTMGASDNFYHTQESAGGGTGHGSADDLYHAYCNCTVAVVFRRRGEIVAKDPDTGEVVPYDGAELVRRYREAGSPKFRKNRQAEAERRRIRRRNGEVPTTRGSRNAYAGKRLSDKSFEEAMERLSGARTVDELHAIGDDIVANWPKNYSGRNQAQWAKLSKTAKEKEKSLASIRVSSGLDGMEAWLSQFEPEVARVEIGGREIVRTVGTSGESEFPRTLPDGLSYRTAELFHTHTNPVSGTFSDDDIVSTVRTCAKKHTLDHTLTGDRFVLIRTDRVTKKSREAFAREYKAFCLERRYNEEYKQWINGGWKKANRPLPDSERRKVFKMLQPEFDNWLSENAGRFGYVYQSTGVHLV